MQERKKIIRIFLVIVIACLVVNLVDFDHVNWLGDDVIGDFKNVIHCGSHFTDNALKTDPVCLTSRTHRGLFHNALWLLPVIVFTGALVMRDVKKKEDVKK